MITVTQRIFTHSIIRPNIARLCLSTLLHAPITPTTSIQHQHQHSATRTSTNPITVNDTLSVNTSNNNSNNNANVVIRGAGQHVPLYNDPRPNPPQFHSHLPKSNYILMGSPGSGKTSVGRILAKELNRPFIDIDDDWLEPKWGRSVASVLSELGDEGFLEREGQTLMQFDKKNHIVSLTGSNPLHARSMEYIAKDGVIIYLDVEHHVIVNRMHEMKVTRIVGQSTQPLATILLNRKRIYENSYDIRIIIHEGETVQQIVDKVKIAITNYEQRFYQSTRGYNSQAINNNNNNNTNNTNTAQLPLNFLDVVNLGLAPDRGLFLPSQQQLNHLSLSHKDYTRLLPLSYQERCLRIIERFNINIHSSILRQIIYNAYQTFTHSDILPLTPLNIKKEKVNNNNSNINNNFLPNLYLMETYHGPTASFKDLSLQILPQFLQQARKAVNTSHNNNDNNNNNNNSQQQQQQEERVGLLVATSGDTGTAALDGFIRQYPNIPIIVLYPYNGVSIVQKLQMLSSTYNNHNNNVCVIGINKDFDYCQTFIKDLLNNNDIKSDIRRRYNNLIFSSANSMNWGRFLPQIVFSIHSYLDLVKNNKINMGQPINIVIPTGNFGNILGCYIAKKVFHLPIEHIVCASNDNNILYDFINTGIYDLRKRSFYTTISPSIDILVSSNLERFLYICSDGDYTLIKSLFTHLEQYKYFQIPTSLHNKIKKEMKVGWCNQQQCISTIQQTYELTGKFIDPHTAVAVYVANTYFNNSNQYPTDTPIVIGSTAHYGKFPNTIISALTNNNNINNIEVNSDNITQHLSSLFHTLEQIDPNEYHSTMHPYLMELTKLPKLNENICEPDQKKILDIIHDFLTKFTQQQNAKQ